MIKHRLMLSAAAAGLLAALPMAALADVTVNSASTTALATTASGNVTVESTGSIAVRTNGSALALDSDNFIINNGPISNDNTDGSIGLMIDTSDHNVVAKSPGLLSTNAITLSGTGGNKVGVLVIGGGTYFGNITINNTTAAAAFGAGASIVVEGANSNAFRLANGKVDGDITFGGSITGSQATTSTSNSGVLFLFDGDVNGNVYFDSTSAASSIGRGAQGIAVLGKISACASNSAAQLVVGYTCPSGNGKGLGALINAGRIVAARPRGRDGVRNGVARPPSAMQGPETNPLAPAPSEGLPPGATASGEARRRAARCAGGALVARHAVPPLLNGALPNGLRIARLGSR